MAIIGDSAAVMVFAITIVIMVMAVISGVEATEAADTETADTTGGVAVCTTVTMAAGDTIGVVADTTETAGITGVEEDIMAAVGITVTDRCRDGRLASVNLSRDPAS